MKAIELLEARLAEALQALDDAAGFVREAEEVETEKYLRHLGHAINAAWEVREAVHKLRPDLKPDFVKEYETDRARYEELDSLAVTAYSAEKDKKLVEAQRIYQKLRDSARFGYFSMVAEAGLFRVGQANAKESA